MACGVAWRDSGSARATQEEGGSAAFLQDKPELTEEEKMAEEERRRKEAEAQAKGKKGKKEGKKGPPVSCRLDVVVALDFTS